MYFEDEFIKSLPDEPREAVISVCQRYNQIAHSKRGADQNTRHQLVLEGHAFLEILLKSRGVPAVTVSITGKAEQDIDIVKKWVGDVLESMKTKLSRSSYEDYVNTYSIKLGTMFHYEFSEGDLEKIQGLLNELRDLISETQELEEDHRHRLLKRLEKLQSELHKKVSDLDRFWGFFIDASIVIGMVGKNAKPMAEVIQKIVKIIWPTQTRAYELPSDLPFKLLGQTEDEELK